MKEKINSQNLLSFITTYLMSIGCNENELKSYLTANRFSDGLVLNLPAVCLMRENKPAGCKSKQSHIHVTSKAREFFYTLNEIENTSISTDWRTKKIDVCLNNINSLHHKAVSKKFELRSSFTMTKIECRKEGEKQVQLSKTREDDDLFLCLRKGLYENDVLVFLKHTDSDILFVVGIPKSYYEGKYEFESSRKTKQFKGETYKSLISKNAIPVRTAIENVAKMYTSNEVLESEEDIEEAIYQSMVNNTNVEIITTYTPEIYKNQNPGGISTTNHRPATNPALGKEAIKDNNYCCSVNKAHTTFIKPDGTNYMEVHHLIPLNQQKNFKYKLDAKANIIPLCPTCHKMLHLGRIEDITPILEKFYIERKDILAKSGLNISFEKLLEFYK